MYHFRPFRNTDPPKLAEIWRDQPPQRGLMQPVSAAILDQLIFSKPYFDPEGLIIALQGDSRIGFIHAGFGANDEQTGVSTDSGTTYLLMLRAEHRQSGLADEMLAHAETYLRDRGAKVLYGGGVQPLNAFYLGLYGGSELPGVLASDPLLHECCGRNDYKEIDRVIVFQRELAACRPAVSRAQRQLRRELEVREMYAPSATTFWEACTFGDFEQVQFVAGAVSGETLAEVQFWNIEPLSDYSGAATAGLLNLHVKPDRRRQGTATFLLGEAFERLRCRGIMRVEAQTMQHNQPAIALYEKLGFQRLDQGIVYRKEPST